MAFLTFHQLITRGHIKLTRKVETDVKWVVRYTYVIQMGSQIHICDSFIYFGSLIYHCLQIYIITDKQTGIRGRWKQQM